MNRPRRRRLATTLAILAATLLGSVVAFADEVLEEVSTFDIPDQPLDQALLEFSKQADVQIIMAAETTRDLEAVGIHGQQRNRDALERLLADRGLQYTEHSNRTIAVHQVVAADEGGDSDSGNGRTAGATPRSVMMAQTVAEQSQARRRTETDSDKDERRRPIDEIIVTGTHIRGIAPESSPVSVYDREDILNAGAATMQEFIKTLPQNFGGGADESFTSVPGNEQAGSNDSEGSSVNLRGLGSGSTLVLLNGRRLAASSDIGGFTDISMIPASAVERVEVLTDGASSIYGADAVAGVVNFVLRDDYKGIETSIRYGVGTQHSTPEEYRASLTGGANWDSGNGLVLYEYYKRDSLDADDRDFSDFTGDFLLPGDSPNDLLPRQERHSVLGSLSQQLAPDLAFGADILFSQRDSKRLLTILSGGNIGSITDRKISNDNVNVGANLTWNVASDWYVDLSGNYSKLSTDFDASRTAGSSFFRNNDADYWAMEAKASGTVFDLPGGSIKLAVGGHYRQESFLRVVDDTIRNDGHREVHAYFGEVFLPIIGPNNALPGVRRLEINASGRFEDYSDFGSQANPKVGLLWAPTDQLRLRGSYSTSFKPPTVGQTGALDALASTLPTSFILSILDVPAADPSIADVVLLQVSGVGGDIEAETSRALSGGFNYDVDSGRHSLSLASTYFDIVFKDRLSRTPMPGAQNQLLAFNIAFASPELLPEGTVVFSPSSDEINAVLSTLDGPPFETFGLDPADTEIISFATVTRNLSATEVRGIDFDATYSFDGDFGSLILGIDGTYLLDFTQQAAVTTPVVDMLDTQYNPLNLKLRGRVGYARDGFNANLFVNYADDYRVDNTDTAVKIDSWTTVDLSLSYDTQKRVESSVLENTIFRLSVVDLFDEDPPDAPSFLSTRILGYDPTNASPLGRFISFKLTKRF